MNWMKHLGTTLVVVFSLSLILSQAVYASIDVGTSGQAAYAYYIGPGTFAMIAQAVLAFLIGAAAMIVVYRTKVKDFFTGLLTRKRRDKEREETEEREKRE